MSHEQLRRMLDESASRVEVGPAPVVRSRSRVPLVAAGAVAAVVAVVGGAVLLGETETTLPPTGVGKTSSALLTAEEPADRSMLALLHGRVEADDRGCVVLADALGTGRVAVWPYGWEAEVDGGRVTLRDDAGEVVAHEGDVVSAGGGYVPLEQRLRDDTCAPADVIEVPHLQSELEFESPAPIDLPTNGSRPYGASEEGGNLAALRGVLRDDDGCLRVGGRPVRWPGDVTAERTADGTVVLRDPTGAVAAVEGDTLFLGGGQDLTPDGPPSSCAGGDPEDFSVQSTVMVVPPGPDESGPLLVAPAESKVIYTARIAGELGVDERGCVVVGGKVAIWPPGWSAEVTGDVLTLRDPGGAVVGAAGDEVEAAGTPGVRPGHVGDLRGWRCYPDTGMPAWIQGMLTVGGG